jgi:endonuclease YncB( thermonuclease family)
MSTKSRNAMYVRSVRIARALGTVLVACCARGAPTSAAEITGVPRIVDGDTVEIGQTKVRLSGIDAPETDQICLDAKGERWACGIAARDQLTKHSGGQAWECETTGTDRYGRSLGNCFVEGEDVSAWMVRSGWALSFVRYSHAYDADEVAARDAHAGLWRLGTGDTAISRRLSLVLPRCRSTLSRSSWAPCRHPRQRRLIASSRATSTVTANASITYQAN